MAGQFSAVVNHETLLEIARAELHAHVEKKDDVGKAVAAPPQRRRELLQFGHTLAHYERPQIVKYAERQQHEPIVIEVLVRIDHGRWSLLDPSRLSPLAFRVLFVGLVTLALASVDRLLALGYLTRRESLEERIFALERWLLLDG